MAFPTTGVIDAFNRANETPLSDGGKWSQGPEEFDGVATLRLLSNQVAQTQTPDTGDTKGGAYRNDVNYGPDAEAFVDVAVVPEFFMSLFVRVTTPGVGTTDGYFIFIDTPSGSWTLARKDNGTSVVIGSGGSQAVAAGSKVGLSIVGTTLTAWYQAPGGSWTAVASTTDTTYSAAGRIAMKMRGDLGRFDNFGGGTVVTTQTLSLGRRAGAATVRGSDAEASGTATLGAGHRASAPTLRGATLGATGSATLGVGHRAGAATLRGTTAQATGSATLGVGHRASAAVRYGVRVAPDGGLTLALGRKTSGAVLRGATLAATGTTTLSLAQRASTATVRGTSTLPTGAATLTLARRTSSSTLRGIAVEGVLPQRIVGLTLAATTRRSLTLTGAHARTLSLAATPRRELTLEADIQ